jgi:hypothetical protein
MNPIKTLEELKRNLVNHSAVITNATRGRRPTSIEESFLADFGLKIKALTEAIESLKCDKLARVRADQSALERVKARILSQYGYFIDDGEGCLGNHQSEESIIDIIDNEIELLNKAGES